jgi:uncharacterized protein
MRDGHDVAGLAFTLAVMAGLCLVAAGFRLPPPPAPPPPTPLPALTLGVEGFDCVQPLPDPPRLGALIIGDSNIFGPLGKFLQRGLGALGYDVDRRGKPTSGLARPDFFDWWAEARTLLDAHQPDLVIAMFGGNDGQRMESTDLSRQSVRIADGGAWGHEYQRRVRSFAALLRGQGRAVFILSPTNRRPRFAREKMQKVRAAQREALEGMQGVTWIDMFPLSSDEHGEWLEEGVDVDGDPINYRRPDGIHLTPAGGQLVGHRVLERLLDNGLTLCGKRD